MFHRATEQSEHMQPSAIIVSSRVQLQQASIKGGFQKLRICASIVQETRSPAKLRDCCCVTIESYSLHFFHTCPSGTEGFRRDGSYLQLIWRGVRRLGGVYSEDVGQAAGHQQTHVLVGVFEEEVGGQVQGQIQVELLLFFRVLVHVHEGLHHHLHRVKFQDITGASKPSSTIELIDLCSIGREVITLIE